jgi:hypothetical protein
MTRMLWFAALCLASLGTAIAISAAVPTHSSVAKSTQAQSTPWSAFTLNETAKSDRLALPVARTEIETVTPTTMPVEAPSMSPEEAPLIRPEPAIAATVPDWREANAKAISAASSRRLPQGKKLKRRLTEHEKRPTEHAANEKPPAFHCRQDAVGSLLRTLDLSPRCDL